MKVGFLSIDTIIDEYLDLVGYEGKVDRSAAKKWANDMVRKLVSHDQFVHKIKLLSVRNYKVMLPSDFEAAIQVAFKADIDTTCTLSTIAQWTTGTFDGSGCKLNMTWDCPECGGTDCKCVDPALVVDVDRLWDLSHPEFRYAHMDWYYRHGGLANNNVPCSPYYPEFELIQATPNSKPNIRHHIHRSLNLEAPLYTETTVQYVIEPPVMRLTVKDGQLLLSYFAHVSDDSGYRKVPDIPEIFEAIKWYVEERMTYREFRKTREKDWLTLSDRAMALKEKFMRLSRIKLSTLSFEDFWAELGDYYGKLLPTCDSNGVSYDAYDVVMDRLSAK